MAAIVARVQSGEAESAVDEAITLVTADGAQYGWPATSVLAALADKRDVDHYRELLPYVMSACAPNLTAMHAIQQRYLTLMVAVGRKEEAIQAAKVLYNCACLRQASDAIERIATCLRECHPDGPLAERNFRVRQHFMSAIPGSDSSAMRFVNGEGVAVPPDPFASVVVDTRMYDSFVDEAKTKRYAEGQLRLAGLLLITDHPRDAETIARKLFEASPGKAAAARYTEMLAVCIRAADGGTGRSIAFLESLTPVPRTVE